jgi:CheY-like chemotaxis protein
VDDNATSRLFLEELLRSWHMRPISVAGGGLAFEAMNQAAEHSQQFKLLLVDSRMPEIDGFQLLDRVRRQGQWTGAVIMMLSAGDRPGEMPHCREWGITRYLVTPIKPSDLLETIVSAVRGSPPGAPPTVNTSATPAATTRLRILVAEDHPVNQKLALRLLEKQGHCVVLASDGSEAMRYLEEEHFDLVLMDMHMPTVDGLEAAALIRRREQTARRVPIIALTA